MKTGLFDKRGREIQEGDVIEIHEPFRNSQTHYGENIPHPSGQYTEPLEPEIKTIRATVKWGCGMFYIDYRNSTEGGTLKSPLFWEIVEFNTRSELINAFGSNSNYWIDPEAPGEDDLGYLLDQYPPNTEKELMEYLSGCEVVDTNADSN